LTFGFILQQIEAQNTPHAKLTHKLAKLGGRKIKQKKRRGMGRQNTT